MKRFLALMLILCTVMVFAFTACIHDPSTDSSNTDGSSEVVDSSSSSIGGEVEPPKPETVFGLPVAEIGHYIKDADILSDGETRYLAYTTNEESGEEDNVIAVRTATYVVEEENQGWVYGEESIVVRANSKGWDKYIGSASVVKGSFVYGEEEYAWLMAYCATEKKNDTQNQIGLAVAKEFCGEWVKVTDAPIITFDAAVYGASSVGCYAPSLVNLNKESVIRIFYTYADVYGHFAKFIDVNAANLDALYTEAAKNDATLLSGEVQLPTNGDVAGGDAETMFPNADFAYDAVNGKIVAVKDYSPSASTKPMYADRIELTAIAEEELYTVELLDGWRSIAVWDFTDTPDAAYERLYSATVLSDVYGHIDSTAGYEVVYNVCDVAADNEYWMFSQNLVTIFKNN